MNRSIFRAGLIATVAASVPALSLAAATSSAPVWPTGAMEKNDPRVLAFYDGMCAQYADRQGLAGAERDAFVRRCRDSIPRVFPVGYDESSGGGE